MPRGADVPSATFTLADGRRLAFSRHGDATGYPVVWCHGGLSSRDDLCLAIPQLTGLGILVIAIDRPGIGGSDRARGRRVVDWARDVLALADGQGIDRFATIGWSAGGPFALACAAVAPERVRAAATIGGMAPLRSRRDRRELGLAVDRLLIPLSRRAPMVARVALRVGGRAKPERFKARMLASLPEPDRDALAPLPTDDVVGPTLVALRHGVPGTVDDYRAFGGPWGFDVSRITTPTTMWHGGADDLVPLTHAQRLADQLPAATLRVVPDAGHFLAATHAAAVFGDLVERARA
jgi:pimeloyl-ACP methyl ester carboxylesterase